MKSRLSLVIAALLLVAAPAAAQFTSEIDVTKIYFWSGGVSRLNIATGSGAPSGGVTADTYVDYNTGEWYSRRASGTWTLLIRAEDTNTFTALQTFSSGLSSTTGSFSGAVGTGALTSTTGTFSDTVGINVPNGSRGLQIVAGTTPAGSMIFVADNAATARFRVDNGFNLAVRTASNTDVFTVASATGNTVVSGTLGVTGNATLTANLLSAANYTSSIGTSSVKFLQANIAELVAETLVAQQTQATIGGRIIVAPTNILTAALAAAGTTMTVKYNNLVNGDRVYLEAGGNVEWIAVASSAGGSAGAYTYTVTRNLDGSGANDWVAGDAVLDTGTTGNGYIDLFSTTGVLSGNGPTIVFNVRTGTTYSQVSPRAAVGNLKSIFNYSASDVYGACFGDAGATNICIDATNGIRIRNSTTNKLVVDTGGGLTLTSFIEMGTSGQFYSTGVTGFSSGTGWWLDYNGGTPRFRVGVPSTGPLFSWNGSTLQILNGSIDMGTVTLDTSGLFISPLSGSGSCTYANANTVRWTSSTTFRTAIWRCDDTGGSPFRKWNFDHISDGTSIADTQIIHLAKNANTGGSFGQGELYQRGTNGNLGETLIVGHSYDATTHRYGYVYVGADDSTAARKAVLAIGTPPALTGSSVDVGTITVGFEVNPSNIIATGNFLDEIGIANSTATIRTTIQPGFAGTSTATNFVLLANNGTIATMCSGGGMTVGSPTGGCKGGGTANFAADIYKNNTAYTNPDYVFEHWATGGIVKFANNPGAADYRGLMPLDELERYVRSHYRFPLIPETPVGAFGRGDIALALTEQNTLYIFQLARRLEALEQELTRRR